jgi:hypothetical protein
MSSIIRFKLGGTERRDPETNPATCMLPIHVPTEPVDFHDVFTLHFDALRSLVAAHPRDGCLIVAASPSAIEGAAWIETKPGSINSAILGRHTYADIVLAGGADTTLRQIAAILVQDDAHRKATVRLMDLRTSSGMVDERNRRLDSLEVDGPVALGCASHRVLVFPTSRASTQWPIDPESAWKTIPERAYRGIEADPDALPWPAVDFESDVEQRASTTTLLTSIPGALRFRARMVDPNEEPRGELVVSSDEGYARVIAGRRALQRGILIGRYERCDIGGAPFLKNKCLSRVHVIIIEIRSRLYAIDAASKNGLWIDAHRVRHCSLDEGRELSLARGSAFLRWRSFH